MAMKTRKERDKQEDILVAHTGLALATGSSFLSTAERAARSGAV